MIRFRAVTPFGESCDKFSRKRAQRIADRFGGFVMIVVGWHERLIAKVGS